MKTKSAECKELFLWVYIVIHSTLVFYKRMQIYAITECYNPSYSFTKIQDVLVERYEYARAASKASIWLMVNSPGKASSCLDTKISVDNIFAICVWVRISSLHIYFRENQCCPVTVDSYYHTAC